jgi:hypothetical protein
MVAPVLATGGGQTPQNTQGRARRGWEQTLVDIAYTPTISEPKTDRSRRTLAIDALTVTALREHRGRQEAERDAWGPAWTETGHVFTREDGELLHPQLVSRAFERLVRRSGLRRISLHDYADVRVMPTCRHPCRSAGVGSPKLSA